MQLHHDEPWRIAGHNGKAFVIHGRGGIPVGEIYGTHDAWRAVTAVNRTTGLSNKALDSDVIGTMIRYLISMRDFIAWLKTAGMNDMLKNLQKSLDLIDDTLEQTSEGERPDKDEQEESRGA